MAFWALEVEMIVGAGLCADAAFALHGVVLRTQLLRMLKHRIGVCHHDPRLAPMPSKNSIPASQVTWFS